MKKPTLCLECRRKRILCGLANARAKGKLIGRKKTRDSDLIRKLLKSGLTHRQIAVIAKASHGSVSAEKKAMKKSSPFFKLLIGASFFSTYSIARKVLKKLLLPFLQTT
mgnify:CR=1 FL=1